MSQAKASGVGGQNADPASVGTTVPVVELVGITKGFPGVLANDHIDLLVEAGEVVCLLGENGAGKSTLMSILSGMLAPDEGTILFKGEPVILSGPRHALDLGIGMVYQHSTLVPTLSVLENLMLGTLQGFLLQGDEAIGRLDQVAGMLGAEVDPHSVAGDLALGQQQVVEIIKALWKGTDVLILDEPTSMLTPRGIEELTRMLDSLKQHGLAVIFITHKLHEALRMGDQVRVLREGRVAGSLSREELSTLDVDELQRRIVTLMFGEDLIDVGEIAELSRDIGRAHDVAEALPGTAPTDRESALRVAGIRLEPQGGTHGLHDVDLEVQRGQIFGIAGVDGNGQRELAEIIAGQRSPDAGDIILHDGTAFKTVTNLSIRTRQSLGLRYLTDDRQGEGTVRTMSIGMNLLLKRIGQKPFWKRGAVQSDAIRSYAKGAIEEFDIRTPSTETPIGKLSGGNMQKALLARELAFDPRVVIYNKPTYGLDIRTTQVVRARIREQASRGVAALVMSTSWEELLELADQIAVMSKGRIVGTVANGPGAEERIGELMVGEVAS